MQFSEQPLRLLWTTHGDADAIVQLYCLRWDIINRNAYSFSGDGWRVQSYCVETAADGRGAGGRCVDCRRPVPHLAAPTPRALSKEKIFHLLHQKRAGLGIPEA